MIGECVQVLGSFVDEFVSSICLLSWCILGSFVGGNHVYRF